MCAGIEALCAVARVKEEGLAALDLCELEAQALDLLERREKGAAVLWELALRMA